MVGNPSALQRLVDNGRLRLNAVNFVVVDEVDACLIKPESHQVVSSSVLTFWLFD